MKSLLVNTAITAALLLAAIICHIVTEHETARFVMTVYFASGAGYVGHSWFVDYFRLRRIGDLLQETTERESRR